MALELPIPSFPAGGSGSGTVLFDLSASISITAAQFQAGMNQVSAKISAVNDSLTSVISAIGNLESKLNGITSSDANGVSSVKNAVENLASSASTADANVGSLQSAVGDADDAMDGLHDATTQADSALVVIGDTIMTGGSKWENFTSKLSSAWNKLKSFGSTAWTIGSQLVSAAANFENIDYVFSQVLADYAEPAEQIVQYYANQYNIHEAILKRSITSIDQQLKSAGFNSDDAFVKSVEVMNLAAIAASAYGTSVDDATDRLLSFMRGNVEAGEKIGLFTNQLARDSIAQELYQKNWKELSETQRQLALLKIASRKYEPYENVPKDRSSSYGRVVENLKYQWEEIQATLGQPILDTVTPILENLSKWLKENPDAVKNLASAIGAIVQGIADLFKNLANYIEQHPEILALIKWVISKVPTVVTSLLESSAPESPFMTEAEYHQKVAEEYGTTDTPPPAASTSSDQQKFKALAEAALTWDYYGDMSNFEQLFNVGNMEAAQEKVEQTLAEFFTTEEVKKILEYMNTTDIFRGHGKEDTIWRKNEEGKLPSEYVEWIKETFGISPELSPGETLQRLGELPGEISTSIVAALPSALSGIGVYMDSTLVGNLVTPTVTSNMARSSRGKMFTNGKIG